MKGIQVFNRYIKYGGEESSVDRIYEHLGESHELSRCFFESSDWVGDHAPGKISQVLKMFHNKESYRKLAASIKETQPDFILLHNTLPVASPSVYVAAQDAGVPTIQYIHNFRPFSVGGSLWVDGKFCESGLRGNHWPEVINKTWQGSYLKSAVVAMVLKRMERRKINDRVDHWIAISDFMRTAFISAGIDERKITTIRHSWNAFAEMPEVRDEGYYLMMSRLIDEKGIMELLAAWKELESELKATTPKLVIAGEGPLADCVKKAAEGSDLIHYVGQVSGERKHELLASCRAVLAPVKWQEPLGLNPFEAYDYGKPILATSNGGLAETIFHGETGFHFEDTSPAEILKYIKKLEKMSDSDRVSLGMTGRKWLIEECNSDVWKAKFDTVIAKIC